MAISFVQATSVATQSFAATMTLAYTSNNTAGNTLLVMINSTISGGGTLSISDSQGNTFTSRISTTGEITVSPLVTWDSIGCKAGANTITISNPGGTLLGMLAIAEYSGIGSFDTKGFAQGPGTGGTTQSTPTIALAGTGEMAISWFGPNFVAGQTFTAGTGNTLRHSNVSNANTGVAFGLEDINGQSGSISESMTFGSSVNGNTFKGILAYNPPSGRNMVLKPMSSIVG